MFKHLPAHAGDADLIAGPGRVHVPPSDPEPVCLEPCSTATEATTVRRSREEEPLLTATLKAPLQQRRPRAASNRD